VNISLERLEADWLAAIGLVTAWLEPGQQAPVVILDTETTGLDGAQMCDLAILNTRGETLFNSLIRPTVPIPDGAIAVHHITNEMVQYAPTLADVWPAIRALLRGSLIVTYNAEYDRNIFLATAAAHKMALQAEIVGWRCAMKAYAQFYGDWNPRHDSYRWHKLEMAARQCGIAVDETLHHALADTRLTLAVLLHMAAQASKEEPAPTTTESKE